MCEFLQNQENTAPITVPFPPFPPEAYFPFKASLKVQEAFPRDGGAGSAVPLGPIQFPVHL